MTRPARSVNDGDVIYLNMPPIRRRNDHSEKIRQGGCRHLSDEDIAAGFERIPESDEKDDS